MPYASHTLEALKKCKINGRIKIGFFGIGKTNLAVFNAIRDSSRYTFTFRDMRKDAKIPHGIGDFPFFFGDRAYLGIDEDVLFLSPSVNRSHPALAAASARGTILTSDCEEFFFATRVPVFVITGSDGKSTVTTLTSRILTQSGYSSPAIGNIGVPFMCAESSPFYTCELSSFNLEYFEPRSCAAAITNITPNHLDFHSSFATYRQAKLNILKNTLRPILSYDDPECRKIIFDLGAYAVFSTSVDFASLKRAVKAEHYYTVVDGALVKDGSPMIHISSLKRNEEYNLKNMLTAIALAGEYASEGAISSVLSEFSGLKHRCELVGSFDGVKFYNSSIDTTPIRCASTLNALNLPVRLILGGRGKGLLPEVLRTPLLRYAKKIALYGEEGEALYTWISDDKELSRIECAHFWSFDEAFEYATDNVRYGDTVLLSPAATAYGEFASFEERGERFSELISAKYGQKYPKI